MLQLFRYHWNDRTKFKLIDLMFGFSEPTRRETKPKFSTFTLLLSINKYISIGTCLGQFSIKTLKIAKKPFGMAIFDYV